MKLSTTPPPGPATPALTRIGRFQITRELGRGTVGSVYLAHDPVIDRQVAIKTFNAKLTATEKKRYEQQFINEARAAGRLSHHHIVTIFEASSEGGVTYIAMEYLQGRELGKLLDKGSRFKPDEVASIIWKIADALDYAHKNGVVHRDIKPDNIFMVGDNHPKIVDFGIARAPNRVSDQAVSQEEPYTLFRNNKLLGTPNYMSPEQALGLPVDLRTDIYSIGAVMYEMLVGRKPFQSSDPHKLLQLVAYKAPEAPHAADSHIPSMLSHIVMKAMNKRAEKRYQTAEEMALDIKRYLVKEKRSRQRLSKEMPIMEQRESSDPSSHRRRLFWIGGFAGTVALAIVGYALLY